MRKSVGWHPQIPTPGVANGTLPPGRCGAPWDLVKQPNAVAGAKHESCWPGSVTVVHLTMVGAHGKYGKIDKIRVSWHSRMCLGGVKTQGEGRRETQARFTGAMLQGPLAAVRVCVDTAGEPGREEHAPMP